MLITMPRGDIHYVDITISSDDETYSVDYDEIYFTVKRKYTDTAFLFQKRLSTGGITKIEDGKYRIKIDPADTNNLDINKPGEFYDCDIEILYQDLVKSTFFGQFILTRETTYACNEG